ncbi:D-2-hydroxyacid dehydrogenase [Roseiterribacter gracilis]|uniref:Glycerate dehydrogenase n=1 Tax=Roseiterribacter gracilis TaxID=2812848 RepID=A0A8S8XAK8_9PROT|nr:glycerate dehydrogenase [Rhodospirillales bacterium TMPK1]
MTHKIVFLDRRTIADGIKVRRPAFPHVWVEHDQTAQSDVIARLADATIAITNKVPIRADAIAALPKLQMIAVSATGTDNVDKDAAAARGIPVVNIAGYAARTVPEHVFALLLALKRNIVAYRESVLEGRWTHGGSFCVFAAPITDLAGQRLGIVGTGAIGDSVAQIGRAFGMDVVLSERPGVTQLRPGRLSFDEVLTTSDALSLHCPLTDETRHMINDASLAKMKPGAVLINTARGPLIDELALERALQSGKLGGAGLDVTAPEPPPEDAPILRIARFPNVIVTPHVAWASETAMQTLADRLIDNIEAFVGKA